MSWKSAGIEIPFTYGFAVSRSRRNSAQECVNYRPNVNSKGGVSTESLYQTEGIDSILSAVSGAPCRGSHTMNGKPYFVIGFRLYRVDLTINPDLSESWTYVDLGEILGSADVIIKSIWSSSGYEMAIVDPGNHAYSFLESTSTLSSLSGVANFLSPVQDVASINGFMVFLQAGTNKVFHSNLNDITTYNAVDFELITRIPKVNGLLEYRGQLYVMGEHRTLPYSFIGGINFVFRYQPNSSLPGGIVNQYCKTVTGSSFFYVGGEDNDSPAVWMSNGGFPEKISDESLEFIIRGNSLISQAIMMNYGIDGGKYISLTIGGNCFHYDLVTRRWHTRTSRNNDAEIPWRARHVTKAYDRLLTGDSIDGRIGCLSNADTEYGDNVHRYFVTMPIDNKGRYVSVSSIMLIMDTGFNGDMILNWSDDGETWSDGVERPSGDFGDYGKVVQWDRLGAFPVSRMIRVGTSSGVKSNISKVLAR